MKCVHCGKDRCVYGRGLCGRCYYTPGLRERYPYLPRPRSAAAEKQAREPQPLRFEAEMTADEVERMVAEQMECLPDWFHRDMRELGQVANRERDREAYDRFAARTSLPRKWRGKA